MYGGYSCPDLPGEALLVEKVFSVESATGSSIWPPRVTNRRDQGLMISTDGIDQPGLIQVPGHELPAHQVPEGLDVFGPGVVVVNREAAVARTSWVPSSVDALGFEQSNKLTNSHVLTDWFHERRMGPSTASTTSSIVLA